MVAALVAAVQDFHQAVALKEVFAVKKVVVAVEEVLAVKEVSVACIYALVTPQ